MTGFDDLREVAYKDLVKDLEEATEFQNIDKEDCLEIEKDDNFEHGYKVHVNFKAGVEPDENEEYWVDLDDLFTWYDIDNAKVSRVLDAYRDVLADLA